MKPNDVGGLTQTHGQWSTVCTFSLDFCSPV